MSETVEKDKTEKNTTDKHRKIRDANLKPFKPGQSGNPAGRKPLEKCITSQIKLILTETPDKLPGGEPNDQKLTNAQIFARVLIEESVQGNSPFAKELLDRVEGKVPTDMNINSDSFRLILGVKGNNGGNDQTDQP